MTTTKLDSYQNFSVAKGRLWSAYARAFQDLARENVHLPSEVIISYQDFRELQANAALQSFDPDRVLELEFDQGPVLFRCTR